MRTLSRRGKTNIVRLLTMLVIGLAFAAGPASLQAQQNFPSKPIEIVVPFAAGGFIDVGIRILSDPLSRELKVPIVVRNQPGGGGMVGVSAYLKLNPDGYTVLATTGTGIISTVRFAEKPYFDPRKDFLPIGYIADSPAAISVQEKSPFKTVDDFIQYARNNPGKLRGGFSAVGGEAHIMLQTLIKESKIESKVIPYVGTGELNTAILGGHLDWMAASFPNTLPFVKSGDLRIILLTRKSPLLSDVPSGADVGFPSISFNMWMGLLTHSQTPKAVHERLTEAVKKVAEDPELIKKLLEAGFHMAYKNPQEFSKLIADQWDLYGQVIQEADLKQK